MAVELHIDLKNYRIPARKFFSRDTRTVAKSLLGAYLRHETPVGVLGGMIVETEAYMFSEPGCHAFNGMTNRNRVMFGHPAHAYTYFTYGAHWMLNIVTEKEGRGCCVLLRALEPIEGIEIMRGLRQKAKKDVDLANGPGKLTQALMIGKGQYGLDVLDSRLIVLVPERSFRRRIVDGYGGIVTTTRIGISVAEDLQYRFYLANHPCVSVHRKTV
ncbi:MAG: DNA-3-methyladenine glycosylase [bacterium]|nr:DNA-3-methyladenine glycosylase [bacterium]